MKCNLFLFIIGIMVFFFLGYEVGKQYEFSACEQIKAQCREVLLNKVNQGGCK